MSLLDFTEDPDKFDSPVFHSKDDILAELSKIRTRNDIKEIRALARTLLTNLDRASAQESVATIESSLNYSLSALKERLDQIVQTYTSERAQYYIDRLVKSLTTVKENEINDLNMNRWKELDDVFTDSLWYMEKRDRTGAHNAGYWGNFVPQIPYQLFRRFTKKFDWVLDTFVGSGTTLIECKRQGRNGIGIDLAPEAIELTRKNLLNETNRFGVKTELVNADSTVLDYPEMLNQIGIKSVQLVIMHPPYWDIIKFSDNQKDLANAPDEETFLAGIRTIGKKSYDVLEHGRYLALVIGDKYSKGEWIPLGFESMNEMRAVGFKLKSVIVKNFDVTKGKRNQEELWRYRAIVGNFYVFKHEYIFIFVKD